MISLYELHIILIWFLGLIAQLPRRASAYDVFRGEPGRGGGESSPVVGRRSSFRAVPPPDSDDATGTII